jgi:hypothetical protein
MQARSRLTVHRFDEARDSHWPATLDDMGARRIIRSDRQTRRQCLSSTSTKTTGAWVELMTLWAVPALPR